MDGDLQDHPEDIPLLYAKLLEGHEVVYGVKERKNESALRNLFSRTVVRLLKSLSDYDVDFNTPACSAS
jgi:dolichol-phosphate mannosyltransferase